jgi:hypothetical protein
MIPLPLSPRATALLKEPHNPYRPEENLYVALVGFDAPAGESVVTYGQARIDRNNAQLWQALAPHSAPR